MAQSRGEHAHCPEGTLINGRYKVLREAGHGNFSKVYKCVDTKAVSPAATHVAVKLLKREYAADSAFEADILKTLGAKDKNDQYKVLKMLDSFHWNRHPCFVFPLKGPPLRNRKFGVAKGHVTRLELAHLAFDLLTSLKFLHFGVRMVHTDLKPENILLESELPTAAGGASASAVAAAARGLGNGWTIVDFGSASFYRPDKQDSDLISTRPYRAPEVILGQGWSYPADSWSLGCILFEVFHGSRLFEVHDDAEHLRQIEQRLGRLPPALTRHAKNSAKFFDPSGALLPARTKPATPAPGTAPGATGPLDDLCRTDPAFGDLVKRLLDYVPSQRLRADDALGHAFFDELYASGVVARGKSASPPQPAGAAAGFPAADGAPRSARTDANLAAAAAALAALDAAAPTRGSGGAASSEAAAVDYPSPVPAGVKKKVPSPKGLAAAAVAAVNAARVSSASAATAATRHAAVSAVLRERSRSIENSGAVSAPASKPGTPVLPGAYAAAAYAKASAAAAAAAQPPATPKGGVAAAAPLPGSAAPRAGSGFVPAFAPNNNVYSPLYGYGSPAATPQPTPSPGSAVERYKALLMAHHAAVRAAAGVSAGAAQPASTPSSGRSVASDRAALPAAGKPSAPMRRIGVPPPWMA